MALINCSECGKGVSDKASSCPNCGNPMRNNQNKETQMNCPKCGSSQLTSNKKGFSGGKAAAGVLLTGSIGLLAGTIGSENVLITCLKCGNKFKAGEYDVEKRKHAKNRAIQEKALEGGSLTGIAILFLIFSIMGAFISFKLFSIEWYIIGTFFAIATVICLIVFIFCIYTESGPSSRKKLEIDSKINEFLDHGEKYKAMSLYEEGYRVSFQKAKIHIETLLKERDGMK